MSEFSCLYDMLIPADHEFRQLLSLTDFSFIRKELSKKYSKDMGCTAKDPVMLFKYIMLKHINPASDDDLVERSRTDLSYKFFLGLNPEDEVIDSSLLSKFRRQRMKDVDLLDLLLKNSVGIAIEQGVIKSKTDIIIDATHSLSCFNTYTPKAFMQKYTRMVVRSCASYIEHGLLSADVLPERPSDDADTARWRAYSQDLIDALAAAGMESTGIGEKTRMLREGLEDLEWRSFVSRDKDARRGHKSKDKPFVGYKEHLAATEEGIITGAVVTSGEKADGDYLPPLVEQSEGCGLQVDGVIADAAYSGKDNLDFCQEHGGVKLAAPLNPNVENGTGAGGAGFRYNKDAGTFQCPADHLATMVTRRPEVKKVVGEDGKVARKHKNAQVRYHFDVAKCRECPLREGCYKPGAKSKTHVVTVLSEVGRKQKDYQKTEEYRHKEKKRFRIESLNAHLKNDMGMRKAISYGLESMEMQVAVTIYAANLMRIIKIKRG